MGDRKSTRLNSSHRCISYAVFCLNTPSPTYIYTLSLHDALPICKGIEILGRDREGEGRRPVLVGRHRHAEESLLGLLVVTDEQFHGDRYAHSRHRADRPEQADGQPLHDETQATVHDEQVRPRSIDRMLDAALQSLQHAEQRKGNAHLEEDEDRASRLTPDAGPDERQEFHSAAPAGAKSLFASASIH